MPCPFCSSATEGEYSGYNRVFYNCNTCGVFETGGTALLKIDRDIYAPFLFYNNRKIHSPTDDDRYSWFFIGESEFFDEARKSNPFVRLLTTQEVDAWYPRDFNEKVNHILLGLARISKYMGDTISLSETQIKSMFFVNRYRERKKTEEADQKAQIDYIAEYMSTQKLIKKVNNDIIILPEGLKRIDELQKNQSNSKQAFVAMSFAKEMTDIREAVRQGIEQANYMPRFMDEIEHNKQIIPEMLYEIKQSKFVVAELTGHNNGAYYEAGYAKGLGKEVIHVCRKDTFGADGHFDVAQISTVLWETEAELSERLEKRIKATIK